MVACVVTGVAGWTSGRRATACRMRRGRERTAKLTYSTLHVYHTKKQTRLLISQNLLDKSTVYPHKSARFVAWSCRNHGVRLDGTRAACRRLRGNLNERKLRRHISQRVSCSACLAQSQLKEK